MNLEQYLATQGIFNIVDKGGVICGLNDYLTTRAIVVGLGELGYELRYCYPTRQEADAALEQWDGIGHPPGNWVKAKGIYQGEPVDMLNPEYLDSVERPKSSGRT
jgi:hypothetical protein